MAESKLTSALIAALEDPKSAGDRIRDVSEEATKTAGEAELIARLLKLFPMLPDSSAKTRCRVSATRCPCVDAGSQR